MSPTIRSSIRKRAHLEVFLARYTTFIWTFRARQTIPPSLMSAMTLQHWLWLLFPISQVKLFIALNNNVDIRGL